MLIHWKIKSLSLINLKMSYVFFLLHWTLSILGGNLQLIFQDYRFSHRYIPKEFTVEGLCTHEWVSRRNSDYVRNHMRHLCLSASHGAGGGVLCPKNKGSFTEEILTTTAEPICPYLKWSIQIWPNSHWHSNNFLDRKSVV